MSEVRLLADGLYFGEGPRWHDGRLWFSDFLAHCVKSVSLDGDVRTEWELEDRPSGLGWMPDGSLLVVSMEKRQLLRRWPDGRVSVHADLSTIATFHCNDMVVDRTGRAYVGNFGFDLDSELESRGPEAVFFDHPTADLAVVSPDGQVSLAAPGMHFPNGMVITPDGATLIVAETLAGALTAFDVAHDGTLANRRVWAPTWPRIPDGIAFDAQGAVWVANPLAPECVRFAQGGAVLDVVQTEHPCFACMLGGPDGQTLFMMTAPTSHARICAEAPLGRVFTARAPAPHAGWP